MHAYKILYGGGLNENDNLEEEKLVMHGSKILYGDELNENDNSKEGKLVIHGYKFRFPYMKGTILLIEFCLIFNREIIK